MEQATWLDRPLDVLMLLSVVFIQPATLRLEHELNNQKAVNNRSHYISHLSCCSSVQHKGVFILILCFVCVCVVLFSIVQWTCLCKVVSVTTLLFCWTRCRGSIGYFLFTTDFMNSGKECVVCQTLRIVLDFCPTSHILDVISEFRCMLFDAEYLNNFWWVYVS
jgi:hypothetical protein